MRSGLMNFEQFQRARDGLLKLMRDDEANELNGTSSEEDNGSYTRAKILSWRGLSDLKRLGISLH
jgi:hypothetical protein